MRPRSRALWWSLTLVGILLLVGGIMSIYMLRSTPLLRDRVVAALNERFKSQVRIETLDVTAFPRPGLRGSKLELRPNGRTDVPPLITIRQFSGTADLLGLLETPLRVRTVSMEGLNIQIPPGSLSLPPRTGAAAKPPPLDADPPPPQSRRHPSLVVDRIEAADAWLELQSKNPLKPPRVFDIHQLVMRQFRPDTAAEFTARLTNPIPEGEIETSGSFGPWIADSPRETRVSGTYTLQDARLDDIKGLDGLLSSAGSYDGSLERIAVRGETTSSDFAIDLAHQPVPLDTRFTAVVDATNGDTYLEQVEATLIETPIVAKGEIVRARDVKGRRVALDVAVNRGRIEDLLRLAMRPGVAPLRGRIEIKSRMVIPAGDRDVIERMQLDGSFSLTQARFTNFNIQKRINLLSNRARGEESDDDVPSVVSNVSGRFAMRNTTLTFSNLAFSVPGARVELTGTYGLRSEEMSFKGDLLLDASLADTTSGLKALAARIVQPLFRRPGGGSKLPIKITGTRDKPSFGLDLRRALLPG